MKYTEFKDIPVGASFIDAEGDRLEKISDKQARFYSTKFSLGHKDFDKDEDDYLRVIDESHIKYSVDEVSIWNIRVGDTVLHEGHLKTVCSHNIRRDFFYGCSLFGDSYRGGKVKVRKVVFFNPLKDKAKS